MWLGALPQKEKIRAKEDAQKARVFNNEEIRRTEFALKEREKNLSENNRYLKL